jgi:16S rRNA (guanine1207-N2)-methyltransferase
MNPNSTVPYEAVQQFSVKLGNEQINVVSKPGLPDWNQVSPSSQLLAEYVTADPSDIALLWGSHQAALSVFLARKLSGGELWIADIDSIALEMTYRTLAANKISSVNFFTEIELLQEDHGKFTTVLMQIPKGRKLTRRWLLQAYLALRVGGSFYIAGSNRAGIQSTIKDVTELFGEGSILAYKKGNRIACFIKKSGIAPSPDWVHTPGIAPGTWVEFTITLSDHTFNIRSLPGVFSFDHLDDGSKMLLSAINIPPGAKVLDVGCGYGIIGMYTAVQGAGLVHLIDNNLLAIAACNQTIALNRILNANIFMGDLLNPIGTNKYDLILSNPPFHTEHSVDYQIASAMIRQSYQALESRGQIIIVANRFIRYDHMIEEVFGNISYLAESEKFHVLSGLKFS